MRALDVMLREYNPFPEIFRFANEILQTSILEGVSLQASVKIINDDGTDQRRYNRPMAHEVVLLLTDDNLIAATRDYIVRQ